VELSVILECFGYTGQNYSLFLVERDLEMYLSSVFLIRQLGGSVFRRSSEMSYYFSFNTFVFLCYICHCQFSCLITYEIIQKINSFSTMFTLGID
jgi:hypothetical protein